VQRIFHCDKFQNTNLTTDEVLNILTFRSLLYVIIRSSNRVVSYWTAADLVWMNITRYVSPIKRRDACPVADITRHYGLAHWWTATVTVGSLWWLGRATRVVSPLCVVKKNDITRQRVSTCPTRHPALGTTPTFLPNFRISTAVLASAPLFWRAVLWIIYWLVVIVSGSRTLPSYESAAVRLSVGLSAITSQPALSTAQSLRTFSHVCSDVWQNHT